DEATDAFAKQVREAERILVGVPEKDVNAPGGEQFLVEIQDALRGSGKKGTLARIANSGTKDRYPQFSWRKAYVFLLTKNSADKGWISLSTAAIGIDDDAVQLVIDGKPQEKISRRAFDRLVQGALDESGPARQSFEGNWTLFMSQQGADVAIWLIGIKKT